MGNFPGKTPQILHFLGLYKLFLEFFEHGNIPGSEQEAHNTIVLIINRDLDNMKSFLFFGSFKSDFLGQGKPGGKYLFTLGNINFSLLLRENIQICLTNNVFFVHIEVVAKGLTRKGVVQILVL